MTDARYWVTYKSTREHVTGCDSVEIERIAYTLDEATGLVNMFMRNARDVMENDVSVTKCIVHVYDCVTGCFPLHRTLERVGGCDGLRWMYLDE